VAEGAGFGGACVACEPERHGWREELGRKQELGRGEGLGRKQELWRGLGGG
jgi:hypothetical protein